jgi:hypothetical protein
MKPMAVYLKAAAADTVAHQHSIAAGQRGVREWLLEIEVLKGELHNRAIWPAVEVTRRYLQPRPTVKLPPLQGVTRYLPPLKFYPHVRTGGSQPGSLNCL